MTKKIKPMEEIPNARIDYYVVGRLVRDGDEEATEVKKYVFAGDSIDCMAVDRGIAFQKLKHAKRAANFIFNLMRKTEPLSGCITSQPDEGAEVWVLSLLNIDYCIPIYFSQSKSGHQDFLKNHVLFSSEKDARAASKFVLAALKAKVLRQNLNCLTEAPADGTIVYAISTLNLAGCIQQQFNSYKHMRLLKSNLLFKSEEDAKRALEYIKEQFKPTRPKAVPDEPAEPDAQPPCQLGAIVGAEPDAQADVPAERDNGSDELPLKAS